MPTHSLLPGPDSTPDQHAPRLNRDKSAWVISAPFSSEINNVIQTLTPGGQVLLRAPTGTGKSTLLPFGMLEGGFCNQGIVYVVENRIEIAHQLAFRVADLYREPLGRSVGLITAERTETSPASRLIYVTGGVFNRIMSNNRDLAGVRAVLFDEFDERTMFMDLGFGLCRDAQQRGAQFSMALMSGTLDLARYRALLPTATGLQFVVSKHELQTHFAEHDYHFRDMPVEAAKIVRQIINRQTEGDILIFMPGHQSIKETAAAVREAVGESVDVVSMYSSMAPEQRNKLLTRGERRTVKIATNIAERGLTIEGVSFVIDSGLERMSAYDELRDSMVLTTAECSKSSVTQRQGRANRTGPGEYYALFTENNLKFRREDAAPEVLRGPLRSALLFARSSTNRQTLSEVAALFPDPPSLAQLGAAEEQLVRLGVLEPSAPETLSPLGTAISRLGCDPLDGARLIDSCRHRCASQMATLIAFSMSANPFIEPVERREAAERAHERFFRNDDNDIGGLLRLFNNARRCSFSPQWCRRNYLSRTALLQIDRQRKKLLRELGTFEQPVSGGRTDDLLLTLCQTSPEKIFFKDSGSGYRNYLTLEPARLSGRSHARTHQLILAADQVVLQSDARSQRQPLITRACGVPQSFVMSDAVKGSIPLIPQSELELESLKKRCLPERFDALRRIFPNMNLEMTILPDPFEKRGQFYLGRARIDLPDFGTWSTPNVRCASAEYLRHHLLKMIALEGEKLGLPLEEISYPEFFREAPRRGGYLDALKHYARRFELLEPRVSEDLSGDTPTRTMTLDFGGFGEVSVTHIDNDPIAEEQQARELWASLRTMEERGGLAQFYLAMRQADRASNQEFDALFEEVLKQRQIVGVRYREVPQASSAGLVWSVEIQIPLAGETHSVRGLADRSPARARFSACKAGYYFLNEANGMQ